MCSDGKCDVIPRVIKENGGQFVLDFVPRPVSTSLLGWTADISVLDEKPKCVQFKPKLS